MRTTFSTSIGATNRSSAPTQARATLTVSTRGPGFVDISREVAGWLTAAGVRDGLLTLFVRHTSASLVIQENADRDVQADLIDRLAVLAPEDAPYRHTIEGPDDMPAHIKSMLTATSLGIPVEGGRMMLGTWQAIYLAEHRTAPHERQIVLHYIGTVTGKDED
jgi:secondary thiamine-phosphate synthase enzyme